MQIITKMGSETILKNKEICGTKNKKKITGTSAIFKPFYFDKGNYLDFTLVNSIRENSNFENINTKNKP